MTWLLLDATGAAGAAGEQAAGPLGMLGTLIPFALIFVVMYFMIIRPQKKREKQVQEMRSKIEVGDEIITSGGIIGIVVSMRDDSVVIESGSDRSKIRIARWAVQSNQTAHDVSPEVK